MHSIKSSYDKILCVLKEILGEGHPLLKTKVKPGPKTTFNDVEVIALSCTAESMGYTSENYFFSLLNKIDFPGLLSRRQFNDRRRKLHEQIEEVRKQVLMRITNEEQVFIVDSMPLKLCRLARQYQVKIRNKPHDIKPNKGFCASQDEYFFGYKLHAVVSLDGVVQFFDIKPASHSDISYLDIIGDKLNAYKPNGYKGYIRLIGDKGYISKSIKHSLSADSKVSLLTDSRSNAKPENMTFIPEIYKGKRKRIETVFSQLAGQFNIQQNNAKTLTAYFTRIWSKLLSMTILNYINQKNNKPVSKIKYALL